MKKNLSGKWLSAVIVVIVATGLLIACTPSPQSTSGNKPTITLAQNPWLSSRLNVAVAKIILEEKMGYPVTVTEIDEYAQWNALAKGDVQASLEVWPSGHMDDVKKYIDDQKTVDNGGLLGPVGKIGWFIPTYMLQSHPDLATWEGLKKPENVALFKTSATGDKGQFLTGDPSWTQHDTDIIKNLGLNLQVVALGSEKAMLNTVEAAYDKRQPILFYFWTPHSFHYKYDLTAVALPPYSDTCYAKAAAGGIDCDYPTDPLFKILWPGLKTTAPQVYQFLKSFNYTTRDQIQMMAKVDFDGKSIDDVARDWVNTHESVWKSWLP
jgi:glycine betaine/proline transport system substrate-binding protein